MPIALALLLQSAEVQADIAHYRDLTRASYRCDTRADQATVIVCGRRGADRFRVPLIEHDAGDPAHISALDERAALIAQPDSCQQKAAILVGCGSVGIGMHAGAGGVSLTDARQRPIAP